MSRLKSYRKPPRESGVVETPVGDEGEHKVNTTRASLLPPGGEVSLNQKDPLTLPKLTVTIPLFNDAGKRTGATERRVAEVVGNLAVHPGIGKYIGSWAVTHAPTGLLVVVLPTREVALETARLLWGLLSMTFRQKNARAVLLKTPRWLKPWLQAVREHGALLPLPAEAKKK